MFHEDTYPHFQRLSAGDSLGMIHVNLNKPSVIGNVTEDFPSWNNMPMILLAALLNIVGF